MALEILHRLDEHARTRGSDLAICEVAPAQSHGRIVTFAQLAAQVRSLALTVRGTVSTGDVVIVCLPNVIDCTAAFLAVLRSGAVGFLISPSATDYELRSAAHASSAKALFGTPEAGRALVDLAITPLPVAAATDAGQGNVGDAAPEDQGSAGLMLLSSGTTGDPKIVKRDGASLDAVARNVATATNLSPGDRVLGMIPLCHSYGVEHGILAPTYAGCAVHLCRGFDTRVVIEQLQGGGVTVLPGVPSVFEMLAGWGDGSVAFPSLRCAYSAGSQLPMSVFESCRKKLRLRVGQLYGSSEVGSVTFNDPHAPRHDPMSVGWVMDGVDAIIVDPQSQRPGKPLSPGVEGELAIRSPSMLTGYVGEDESPLTDGYFLTGDLARRDAGGALTITGRIKLLIDVGALKVNPLEVEAVLCRHDGVRECVAVAARVTDTISRVRALIVPRDAHDPPSVESLRLLARSRLSAHKVPRMIEIVDSLPKSPTGKILRRQIAS